MTPIKVDDYILLYPAVMSDTQVDNLSSGLYEPTLNGAAIDESAVTMFHNLCDLLVAHQYYDLEMDDVPWGVPNQRYHLQLNNTQWLPGQQVIHNHPATTHYLVTASAILDALTVTLHFDMQNRTVSLKKGDLIVFPYNYSFRFTPNFAGTELCRVSQASMAALALEGKSQ